MVLIYTYITIKYSPQPKVVNSKIRKDLKNSSKNIDF